MKRTLAVLAVLTTMAGNAWAQEKDQNSGSKTVFKLDGTPSISFMQPIAQENNFGILLAGLNVSLFKLEEQSDKLALRFLTVGLGGGIRKADESDSRGKRATLGDLVLTIYPVTLPLYRVYDVVGDMGGEWELSFSPGVTRNLTHGSWGFVFGFLFAFPQ